MTGFPRAINDRRPRISVDTDADRAMPTYLTAAEIDLLEKYIDRSVKEFHMNSIEGARMKRILGRR